MKKGQLCQFIMITAFGNVEAAVTAMKKGAYDFITKPFDENELLNVIEKALSEYYVLSWEERAALAW
jgi:FixJ family two-component response regulator